jgi:energy-coupling factor transporter ATP-binding protein EcfA2
MRAAYRAFLSHVQERQRRERDIEDGFQEMSQKARADSEGTRARLEDDYRLAREKQENQRDQALASLKESYDELARRVQSEYEAIRTATLERYQTAKSELEEKVKDQRWHIGTRYDTEKRALQEQLARVHHEGDSAISRLEEVKDRAAAVLRGWLLDPDPDPPRPSSEVPSSDPWRDVTQCVDESRAALEQLEKMPAPRLVKGIRPYLLIVGVWLLSLSVGSLFVHWYWSLVQATVTIFPLGLLARHFLIAHMERRAEQLWNAILQADVDARVSRREGLKQADDKNLHERELVTRDRDHALAKLMEKTRATLEKLRQKRDQELTDANETYPPRLKAQRAEYKDKKRKIVEEAHVLLVQIKKYHEGLLLQADEHARHRHNRLLREHTEACKRLADDWQHACQRFRAEMLELCEQWHRAFPPWDSAPPADDLPLGLRFGMLDITLEQIPNAVPSDPEMLATPDWSGLDFPALLPFPEKASLLFAGHEEGRNVGIQTLEAVLLRAWQALPPGRMRCTIIDPVGRGENFSAFMHLVDHDPALVNSRIWTEIGQIEQRLSDLTSHMETILQKFLRNQYETLAEYNAQAGEIAEPFRFLVVAHFPVNFSPDAAQRLLSLASAGARCGIYTFIVADTRQPLPQGMHWEDFEKACCTLLWENGRYAWQDEDFSAYPLTLETMPPDAIATARIQMVGERAVAAGKVELPFEAIAPAPEQWWSEHTDAGISVPMGKAGARRLQHLTLGQGTSQHVLVAGKTGSGKSTLLHVLIMQLALRYSPDELELYLIDFKKGVEFKTYAQHGLPHARVVAVESEREFGLSVLQRLDAELARRGELFRQAGVNDLPSYRGLEASARSANGDGKPRGGELPVLPRLLLVVDEFQEFFVEDDKIAQESALLLDRLVRQGRAFGMHLLLGSQTLGGAYSLARTTIDQMAVRIALQCSEADAGLILSRENTEARLLSRPGEAIYNAVNGLLEGNQFFQIVWITDARRDQLLDGLRELHESRPSASREAPIVFEGNAAADVRRNPYLWGAAYESGEANECRAWLGESVAIKDPTSVVFRPQSGANLLMVGQQQDHAFHLLAAAAVSLARPGRDITMSLVLGQALEDEQGAELADLTQRLSLATTTPRELPERLRMWHEELERRLAAGTPGEPWFLLVYGFQRLRDLRRPDDDFGFGRKGEEVTPYRAFMKLLREGPGVAMHTLLWCDNFNNLQRALDRSGLREFEMKVLFQMNANDSSNLMDSPLAAKLGAYRAYLYTEDQGKLEKFRPYGRIVFEG